MSFFIICFRNKDSLMIQTENLVIKLSKITRIFEKLKMELKVANKKEIRRDPNIFLMKKSTTFFILKLNGQ